MATIYITVKNQFDDLHCYPNAPEQVSYLRSNHRHTFMLESTLQVFHEDRELEFYMVKDYIDSILVEIKGMEINKSCENICSFVMDKLMEKYGTQRFYRISCSEDGWNKATVESV